LSNKDSKLYIFTNGAGYYRHTNKIKRSKYPSLTLLFPRTIPLQFNFITCDRRHQKFNPYLMYLRAMDIGTWISLLSVILMATCLAALFIRNLEIEDPSWLFIYSSLIEVGPTASKELDSKRQFSLSLILFLFAGTILAGAYKGILTVAVTAAVPSNGLETFHNAIDSNYSVLAELGRDEGALIASRCVLRPR